MLDSIILLHTEFLDLSFCGNVSLVLMVKLIVSRILGGNSFHASLCAYARRSTLHLYIFPRQAGWDHVWPVDNAVGFTPPDRRHVSTTVKKRAYIWTKPHIPSDIVVMMCVFRAMIFRLLRLRSIQNRRCGCQNILALHNNIDSRWCFGRAAVAIMCRI